MKANINVKLQMELRWAVLIANILIHDSRNLSQADNWPSDNVKKLFLAKLPPFAHLEWGAHGPNCVRWWPIADQLFSHCRASIQFNQITTSKSLLEKFSSKPWSSIIVWISLKLIGEHRDKLLVLVILKSFKMFPMMRWFMVSNWLWIQPRRNVVESILVSSQIIMVF